MAGGKRLANDDLDRKKASKKEEICIQIIQGC